MPLFAKLFRIGSTRLDRGLTCCLQVRALNEHVEGSVRTVLKPWDQRLDFTTTLESNEDDPELLVFIPYVYINSLMDKWRTNEMRTVEVHRTTAHLCMRWCVS
jgi:hypothetical protein